MKPGSVSFDVSLVKAETRDHKRYVTGIASDTLPDLQHDRMSMSAVERMAEQFKKDHLPLLASHKDTFAIGHSVDGSTITTDKGVELLVTFELVDGPWEADALYNEVESGKAEKQLSIGGEINQKNPNAVRFERGNSSNGNGLTRVIHDVVLEHVATTRKSRAANERTRFMQAIVKGLHEWDEEVERGVSSGETTPADPWRRVHGLVETLDTPFSGVLMKDLLAQPRNKLMDLVRMLAPKGAEPDDVEKGVEKDAPKGLVDLSKSVVSEPQTQAPEHTSQGEEMARFAATETESNMEGQVEVAEKSVKAEAPVQKEAPKPEPAQIVMDIAVEKSGENVQPPVVAPAAEAKQPTPENTGPQDLEKRHKQFTAPRREALSEIYSALGKIIGEVNEQSAAEDATDTAEGAAQGTPEVVVDLVAATTEKEKTCPKKNGLKEDEDEEEEEEEEEGKKPAFLFPKGHPDRCMCQKCEGVRLSKQGPNHPEGCMCDPCIRERSSRTKKDKGAMVLEATRNPSRVMDPEKIKSILLGMLTGEEVAKAISGHLSPEVHKAVSANLYEFGVELAKGLEESFGAVSGNISALADLVKSLNERVNRVEQVSGGRKSAPATASDEAVEQIKKEAAGGSFRGILAGAIKKAKTVQIQKS